MCQLTGQLDFAFEAADDAQLVPFRQYFDGRLAAEQGVLGQVDTPHAPFPQQLLDLIGAKRANALQPPAAFSPRLPLG